MHELDQKTALSINEVRRLTGLGRDTIYRAIKQGRLATAKIGGRRVIRRESVERWLKKEEDKTAIEMGFGVERTFPGVS